LCFTLLYVVQAAPTRTSGQAATSGACELPAAAAQAQLSGKPQPADTCDLGKSDANASAAPAQMTDRLVPVVSATQGKKLVCLSICLSACLPASLQCMICLCLYELLCNCLSVLICLPVCLPQGLCRLISALSCPLHLCMPLKHYNNKNHG